MLKVLDHERPGRKEELDNKIASIEKQINQVIDDSMSKIESQFEGLKVKASEKK